MIHILKTLIMVAEVALYCGTSGMVVANGLGDRTKWRQADGMLTPQAIVMVLVVIGTGLVLAEKLFRL
jgi:hypothetical protein